MDDRDQLILQLGYDRRLAHDVLFKHRHPLPTPQFHLPMIDAYHSSHDRVVIEGFRDSAKSTVAEEAICIMALLREFRNCVLIGSSYMRARERLTAIKNEFVVNVFINQLFGGLEGPTWGVGRIVLNNGVCITALGSGQSVRGTKYLDARPDFALIDDLEDEESVRTPEARQEKMVWLFKTLMPALADGARVRFVGNRLDNDAVIVRIANDPSWHHLKFPIMTQAEEGQERFDLPSGKWVALWPEKFDVEKIAKRRSEYERQGLLHEWMCEYMCEADDPATRFFVAGQEKNYPARVRTWEAVYAAYDPARTVNTRSAMTGKAIFSWVGNRLVVWEGDAKLWLPDEIVADMLDADDRWTLAELGVEATGLEEFIMQPLRHKALARRQLLPLHRLDPPKGKDTFIRSLQPFFRAGEVDFVDVSAEARGQLCSFPSGRKDFPNALAYALIMRPGRPIYDGFSRENIQDTLQRVREPWWLVVNASAQYTCAALLQVVDQCVRVHADYVREGPPFDNFGDILSQAVLECGDPHGLRVVVPPVGRDSHDVHGLRVAIRSAQVRYQNGGQADRGQVEIRSMLERKRRGEPVFAVASAARWTLNGFAGAYGYEVNRRDGSIKSVKEGPYQLLFAGYESFVSSMSGLRDDVPGGERRYATDSSGRRYTTILATGVAFEGDTEMRYGQKR